MQHLKTLKILVCQLILAQFIFSVSFAQQHIYTGKITNEKGAAVPWAKITVPTGEFTVSDVNGKFKLKLNDKPTLPMQANVVKQGYVLKGLEFYEETNSIEVQMETASNKPAQKFYIKVFDEDNKPFPSVSFYLDGKTFKSDNYGISETTDKISDNSLVEFEGYEITSKVFDPNLYTLVINVKVKTMESLSDSSSFAQIQTQAAVQEGDVKGYMNEFQRIESELDKEKQLIANNNLRIQDEIQNITERLKSDKLLTGENREQLNQYLDVLEKNVEQNQEAIRKSEEKTRMLLSRLRMMVLQKDSVKYISEKNLEKMKKEKEDAQKKLYLNLVISSVIIAFLSILTIFFYNLNNKIKKQKAEMAEINKDLEQTQRDLLTNISEVKKQRVDNENKSRELKDNVAAAQVIQRSIMPPDSYLSQYFREYFVLYNPKEAVSGDFYWFNVKDDYLYLAVCDCTGHGVSGALTSMIGFHALNHAINAVKNPSPAETLELLNKEFLDAISHNKSFDDSIVSMDVSLCRLNIRTSKFEYAGAKNQLFILRGEELIVIKGEKMSIGMTRGSSDAKFTDHVIDIQPGDKFYVFSDGFADQMGGEDGVTKFMYSNLKDKLVSIGSKTFSQQRDELVQTFVNWKGTNEQTDDLLVIGFKA